MASPSLLISAACPSEAETVRSSNRTSHLRDAARLQGPSGESTATTPRVAHEEAENQGCRGAHPETVGQGCPPGEVVPTSSMDPLGPLFQEMELDGTTVTGTGP